MRKRIISPGRPTAAPPDEDWLEAEQLTEIEITSEAPAHPLEAPLLSGATSGWQAAEPGRQTIRFLFARPQRLRRVWLRFEEARVEHSPEHVLRWSVVEDGILSLNRDQVYSLGGGMFDYDLPVAASLAPTGPLAYSMAPRTVPTLVSRFTNPRPSVQNGTTPKKAEDLGALPKEPLSGIAIC